MTPKEVSEYQQNALDEAAEAIGERRRHLDGTFGPQGVLDGEKIREHQNDRAEAYLEGYVDALQFAGRQVDGIQNVVKYLSPHIDDLVVLRFTGEPEEGLTFVEAENTAGESVSPPDFHGAWEQDGDDWLLRLGVGNGE